LPPSSPSIALLRNGRNRGLDLEELEGFLPGFGEALERLEMVGRRFCRPLLSADPGGVERRIEEGLPVFAFHLASAVLPPFSRLLMEP